MPKHTQTSCGLRWQALKARGNFSVAEIEEIDNDTPWSDTEPRWWLEMMNEKATLLGLPVMAL